MKWLFRFQIEWYFAIDGVCTIHTHTERETVQHNELKWEGKRTASQCFDSIFIYFNNRINYSTPQFVIDNVDGCDWTFASFQLLLFMCKCILFLLAEFRYCVPIASLWLLLLYFSVWFGFFSLFLVPLCLSLSETAFCK